MTAGDIVAGVEDGLGNSRVRIELDGDGIREGEEGGDYREEKDEEEGTMRVRKKGWSEAIGMTEGGDLR